MNIKLQHKNEATNRGERGFQGSVKRKVIEEDTSFSKIGVYMGVSKNNGTPKSYILIGFSIINHLFWGAIIFGNTHIDTDMYERIFGDESVMNHANCGHKIH